VPSSAPAARDSTPSLRDLLAGYVRATTDAGARDFDRFESAGTLTGAGLSGAYHTWIDGANERDDQNLGPRSESVVSVGSRIYYRDANGSVREFTGLMLRRSRTEHFIDSGAFAKEPEHSVARGSDVVDGRKVYVIDVTADGGETQSIYLDAETGLPDRIAYDDDDGRTTVDLSDWRSVKGHRFPFHSVASDGDHPFDTVQTTTQIEVDGAIDPSVFAVPKSRTIEMSAPETVALQKRGGHLYAPVRIGSKTYTFLLDTGAQNVLIDAHVARDAGLQLEGSLQASGATRMGGLRLARLPALSIGSGVLRDLVVTTLDLGSATSGAFHIDGILGYPFFAATTVRIDPVALRMTFGPPGSVVLSGERIPIEVDRAFPEAHLRINGQTDALFIVDTGNAAAILIYRPYYDRHPGVAELSTRERRSYGIGGSTPSIGSTLNQIDVGSVTLYHVETDVMQATRGAFADRFDAGNVGLGLLQNFVVTFDESANALYFEKSSAFDDGRRNVNFIERFTNA